MERELDPLFFVWELTKACNSSCRFCYNVWKDPESAYPHSAPLTLEERRLLFERVLTSLREKNRSLLCVALAGGEPLLDAHLFETAALIGAEGIPINLATNGRLLTKETILTLKELAIKQVEISLPAVAEEQYHTLTGSSELALVRKNILQLKEVHPRVSLTIAITVTRENCNTIEQCLDLAIAFSADTIVLNRFIPGGAGKKALQLLPSPDDLKRVLRIANEKSRTYEVPITVALPIENCLIPHEHYPELNFGSCSCGEAKWVIDPAGNLRVCEQSSDIVGNLLVDDFHTLIADNSIARFRQQNRFDACSDCEEIQRCGGGCRFLA